ncbi:MAG: DUF3825 domain-containing protein [Clostridiales bacterium]|nr:DUF3825 domain-containing protein [Clostridiales bacterium]
MITRPSRSREGLFLGQNNRSILFNYWCLNGFRTTSDQDMRIFSSLPDIADYFTNPEDFIFDKNLPLVINYSIQNTIIAPFILKTGGCCGSGISSR